jgi:arabinoxylan arabinofuranohydrolase
MKCLKILLVLSLVTCFFTGKGFSQNPIIQTIYTADPAPMVHDGTVYLYTTHDEDGSTWFTMKEWRCYSSTDMVNWTDHGSPLSLEAFSWADKDAWAAQCIYRNGKFYFYICAHHKTLNRMAIGVAVSDKPTGPFVPPFDKPLVAANWGDIDPTVFIDDDGQACLYWGNPKLWYAKLNEDMISYNKEIGVVKVPLTKEGFYIRTKGADKRPSSYEEGPWMYKRNSTYYLLYPAGGVPEHLAYSTSKSVTGPWVYQDTIMHIIGKGGAFTNHPGLIDFKGNSYLFYHNAALPGGGGYNRSVCIEQFKFNKDGSIPVILPTKEGVVKNVSNLDPFNRVEAETIAWEDGVETTSGENIGVYVTDIDNNDYIKVRSVDFGKGAKKFEAGISSASSGGRIEIRIDGKEGILLGNLEVKSTESLQKWETQSCNLDKVKGIHDVYLVFKGGKGDLFNFDWWKFK